VGSTELIVVSAIIAIFVAWHLTIGQRTRNAAILNKMYLKIYSLPAWMLCGVIARTFSEAQQQRQNESGMLEWCRQKLVGELGPIYFGAVFSDFWFFWGPCICATVAILLMCMNPRWRSASRARVCAHWIFWPSILCLWVEDWMKPGLGLALNILELVLKSSIGFWVDVVVTIVWIFAVTSWSSVVSEQWP